MPNRPPPPVSAAQAIARIHPGQRILIGSGAAEPMALVQALVTDGEHLADNEVVHLLTLGPAPYVQRGMEARFRHVALFVGANVRQAVREGRADYIPVTLSDIPELIRSRRLRIDVVLIQVSPPDAHGYVSLGVSVDIVRAAVDAATTILAEVNPRMPRTHGDSFLHVDRIDAMVEVDHPLLDLPAVELDDVDREVARNVATLIPDGATLQVGIGRMPDAVLAALAGRRDLGVHTEMMSDGIMRLAEAGVINGRRKTLLPGKIVTSFIMGSTALYEWVRDNPAIEMRPSSFTNDPFVIARNDRMVAVNSALSVDLSGQVAADTIGGLPYSGFGGQLDFIRGAMRSTGGKPIIALRSTCKSGSASRIVTALEQGTGVVTGRSDVRYVVTEYGVADLWGLSLRQRAEALVELAHPSFRPELLAAARARHHSIGTVAPRAAGPTLQSAEHRLVDGTTLVVRRARVSDRDALRDLFYRLSEESSYDRFLGYQTRYPDGGLLPGDADPRRALGLVACVVGKGPRPVEEIVGAGGYDVDPATELGEVAFVVRDDWQGRGVGNLLMQHLHESALAAGLAGLSGDVHTGNRPMMSLFHRPGMVMETTVDSGVYSVVARFVRPPQPSTSPGPSSVRLDQAAAVKVAAPSSGAASW